MIVGTEWLVEAEGCREENLRDEALLRELFSRVIFDLGLKTLGEPRWHKFPGEGGVTGLVMLTESHLACHTFPEFGIGTFNLYCCRERPEWNWDENLRSMFGASNVRVTRVDRGRYVGESTHTMKAGGEA